jgi:peroxiredoxin (alkyl hydroperoxide reductase subunit C)
LPIKDCAEIARVGQSASDFSGQAVRPNLEFAPIALSQFRGKWLVLFSYPLDFRFGSPPEIIAFSDTNDKFAEIGARIIGISGDSVFLHLAWIGTDRKEGEMGLN